MRATARTESSSSSCTSPPPRPSSLRATWGDDTRRLAAMADQLSLGQLVTAGEQLHIDAAALLDRAAFNGEQIASASASTEVRFANETERTAFLRDYIEPVTALATRHGADSGDRHRVVFPVHPTASRSDSSRRVSCPLVRGQPDFGPRPASRHRDLHRPHGAQLRRALSSEFPFQIQGRRLSLHSVDQLFVGSSRGPDRPDYRRLERSQTRVCRERCAHQGRSYRSAETRRSVAAGWKLHTSCVSSRPSLSVAVTV